MFSQGGVWRLLATTTSKETPPRVLITLAVGNRKLKPELSNSPLKTALEAGCQRVQSCLKVLVLLILLIKDASQLLSFVGTDKGEI